MSRTVIHYLSWTLFGAGLGVAFCLGILVGAVLQWAGTGGP